MGELADDIERAIEMRRANTIAEDARYAIGEVVFADTYVPVGAVVPLQLPFELTLVWSGPSEVSASRGPLFGLSTGNSSPGIGRHHLARGVDSRHERSAAFA